MISRIIDFLIDLIAKGGYIGVALAMFIESFFAPIPSEAIIPVAGILAAEGEMNLILVGIVGGLFSYLGTLPFYFIGYFGSDRVLRKFIDKWGKWLFITQDDVDKGFEMFNKYGVGFVFFGRLVPLVRSVISFPAGLSKMNFTQYSIYTIIGSTVWCFLLAGAGYMFGDNRDTIENFLGQFEHVIIAILVIVVAAYFYKVMWPRIKESLLKK